MIKIDPSSTAQNVMSATVGQVSRPQPDSGGKPASADRTVHDRVDLSGAGQGMVNLARGQELASEIRSKPIDESFVADLRKAMEDIFRITRLFTESIRASFKPRV